MEPLFLKLSRQEAPAAGLSNTARTPIKSMTTATVRGRVWVRFIAGGLASSCVESWVPPELPDLDDS
jgi:hypothetical protein